MLHTLALLPNFDFYLCLRVKFHKSLFWVPILAAGGPYWVPISQKNGSLSQSLGVPISFGVSALGLHEKNLGPHSMWEQCLSHGVNFWVRCASGNVYMYTWDQAKICFDHYRCTKSLGALQESRSQVLVYGPSNFVLALRASLTLSFKPFGRSGRVTHAPLDRDALHTDASHTVALHTDDDDRNDDDDEDCIVHK